MRTTPIVALDVPTAERALAIVDTLGELCRFYKIGSELFTAEGPGVVRAVRERGHDVFLDLKFHDIPNTVRAAARSAAALGARLMTVHAAGGRAMIEAAVEGAGRESGVLAVTVLTSMDAGTLGTAWGRSGVDVRDEVRRLAQSARDAGALGVVCSGEEVADLHARHGPALRLLVPGIRLAGGETHDQARVVTPAAAAEAGASYVVLGRAVTGAPDPRGAMAAALRELGTPV
ncbi:MAG: orotidine-5'-phosphate decarboxylase [Gemmatimonadaceae bacterium]